MTKKIIQFLHPGPEHGWDRAITESKTESKGWKDWNRGCHKRKFMVAEGLWTRDPNIKPVGGSFTFWGEWEPQSKVKLLNPKPEDGHPRWLHTPRLRLDEIEALQRQGCDPCAPGGPQNTDPLVFGDRFRYVLCQQVYRPKNTNTLYQTKLARLSEGDVILLGSRLAGKFVLDTVFVVGISAPISRAGALPNWESELHRRVTMDLFEIPPCGLTLYGSEGWSPDKPFSFVPCLPVEGAPRGFRRPVIEPVGDLRNVISADPNFTQRYKISRLEGREHANAVWRAVIKQLLSWKCVLGTMLDEPPDARFCLGSGSVL